MIPDSSLRSWLRMALSAPVRRRALRFAVVVGAVLIAINHGDAILRGDVTWPRLARILLTLAVPYVVSTVSSVAAMREMALAIPPAGETRNEAGGSGSGLVLVGGPD